METDSDNNFASAVKESPESDDSADIESEDPEKLFERYKLNGLPKLEATFPAIHFLTFRADKVKFFFVPSEITNYVDKKIKYYVSIRYQIKDYYWRLRRHTIPVNKKVAVYKLFSNKKTVITDNNLMEFVFELYKILVTWCMEQEEFRLDKFERYKRGEVHWMELDEDDEDFFLTISEQAELARKRQAVLKRMIPPPTRKLRTRKRHGHS